MRHVGLGLLLLGFAASNAPAQGWADKLFDNKTVHNFGTVPRGAQLFHKFPIKNRWAVPLEITNIQSGCGCVTARASKQTLQPLETGYIEVSMDGRRFTGNKTVTVRVMVGPEYVSTAELRVTAFSRADVVFNPGEVNFGTVPAGQTPTQMIDIEYAGGLPWTISEVVTRDAPVTASVKEMYRQPGRVGYQLRVTLKDDAPTGNLKRELYLKTNDPASPLLSVLVDATVQPSVAASPAQLTLGEVRVGEALTRRVVVRGNRPFVVKQIDGLSSGQLDLVGSVGENASQVHILTFKCVPSEPGEFRRALKIRTDAQDSPVVVTISGVAME